jgi:hypothetical protein
MQRVGIGIPEGKRQLAWIHMGRLDDNIKMDPTEVGCDRVDRMHLT